ncbi:hypothetical protein HT576_08375 [Haloterrigena sp. SYSU A121-1]|uniref:Uncharacterized protein n=1 Tax=Haloterrigena gelatinilytica TaxID=2741724 RepID=A0A8J8GKS6_9EURY|nr:hypothetical protein [Haloterrigena gelatinilytica]NUB91035.1 hypothetical protein [Haloterrigena gelatinilytica]
MGNPNPVWLNPVSYAILVYLIAVASFMILIQIKGGGIPRPSDWLWKQHQKFGLNRSWFQVVKVSIVFLIYAIFVASLFPLGVPAVIVGSLLGAFPPFLFEINRRWSKPHIVLDECTAIKYPNRWWVFGLRKEENVARNAVGVHAVIKNEGRKTAKNCRVEISSNLVEKERYHTRWKDKNQPEYNLSPGETRVVDLFWVDLEDPIVETAIPEKTEDTGYNFPGDYTTYPQTELSTGTHRLKARFNASNMAEKRSVISLNDKEVFQMPTEIIMESEEWSKIRSIKDNPSEDWIVNYKEGKDNNLYVPKNFDREYINDVEGLDEHSLGDIFNIFDVKRE